MYYLRLCRSAVAATGGALTGSWTLARRLALGRSLITLPDRIRVVPLRALAFDMAELAETHGLSSLGAEAIGLDRDAARVATARALSDGSVTFERWDGANAPLALRRGDLAVGSTPVATSAT